MQDRQLRPASDGWRAYTGMTISDGMRGRWRVSVIDAKSGQVLAEKTFDVQ